MEHKDFISPEDQLLRYSGACQKEGLVCTVNKEAYRYKEVKVIIEGCCVPASLVFQIQIVWHLTFCIGPYSPIIDP